MSRELIEKNQLLKKEADSFLDELGLDKLISEYGDYKIDGSYAYDIMVWRDLDLYVDTKQMDLDRLHELTKKVIDNYKPFWILSKEDISGDGEIFYFIGFETKILNGVTWNFDIWFISDYEREKKDNYHKWLLSHMDKNPHFKSRMLAIKTDLFRTKEYGSKFFSIDLYKAIIEDGITNTDQFLEWFEKRKV